MSRVFWLMVLAVCIASQNAKADVTIMAGVSQFHKPSDGLYWNVNQPETNQMTPPAAAIRWDSKRHGALSAGVQYTWFGRVTMDAYAVTVDAPFQGGYIPDSGGQCVGTCASLAQWHMSSETQSVAFTVSRHFGSFSLEAGANVYEIRTKGYVNNYQGNPGGFFQYKEARYLGVGPMIGTAYQSGPWSVRLQVWRMEGKGDPADGYVPPATFNENYQATLLAGYTF